MGIGIRFLGITAAAGMAWLGIWTYLFPDRFLKGLLGDLDLWEKPPTRTTRAFGCLCFIVGTYGGILGFIPETFKEAHGLSVIAADLVFTAGFALLLFRHYRAKQ
jgi:hypothetical protein